MDILHLTPEAHELPQNWGEENRLLVDSVLPYNKSYFKKLCLDYGSQCMLDSEGPLRVYIEAKPHHEEFRAKFCGKQITKGKIIPTKRQDKADNTPNATIQFHVEEELEDYYVEFEHIVKILSIDYVMFNYLMIYGNLVTGNTTTVNARSDGEDKHYFVKEYQGNVYAVSSHTHKSPEGIFSVRGHFRKYKSGKVIWIDEYLKGTDKNE